MGNRPRQQGTAYESAVVKRLASWGHQARRLAEGGSLDEGDIETTMHGVRVVVEAKARQVLSVQDVLAKTRAKAGKGSVPVLAWKRLVPVPGSSRRRPVAGEAEVWVLAPEDLNTLLEAAYRAGRDEGLGL